MQLCYEVKTFLLAGHETSAAMLTWTLYQLTQHPDCLAKVRRWHANPGWRRSRGCHRSDSVVAEYAEHCYRREQVQ